MRALLAIFVSHLVLHTLASDLSHDHHQRKFAADFSLPQIGLKQVPSGERVFVELDSGREVFFHGVNAIVKGFPYIPETNYFDVDISLSEKDHATLASLGLNVYRLGSMWKGVEPVRGEYNETYIMTMLQIVASAEKYGMYTILDMHQDVMSERFCGEGVPDWAALPNHTNSSEYFPYPLEQPYTEVSEVDGEFPTREDCSKHGWASYYQTKDAASAFEALYTDRDGLLASWAAFWAKLASSVASSASRSAVIGYELINEPYAGDVFAHPSLLVPGVADRERLQPAYDSVSKQIRMVDDKGLIFFAAVTWDDIVQAGFEHPPGGQSEADRSVFAYHYYEPPQIDEATYFATRLQDARNLQTGSMLTEFERPQNNNSTVGEDPFLRTAMAADRHLQSWTMWEYKTFCRENETTSSPEWDSQQADFGSCKTGYGEHLLWDSDGNFNQDPARKLARTYARAVSGRTLTMLFDATDASFLLRYSIDLSISLPTEVFAHRELNYPSGIDISVEPEGHITMDEDREGNLIHLTPSDRAVDGETITLRIVRRVL